jgi:hypothetical protein
MLLPSAGADAARPAALASLALASRCTKEDSCAAFLARLLPVLPLESLLLLLASLSYPLLFAAASRSGSAAGGACCAASAYTKVCQRWYRSRAQR